MKTFFAEIKEWLLTIVVTVILIIIIRSFIFSPVIVEGESMLPNLHDGDRLFINKIGMHVKGDLERYDVVVFKSKKEKYYIKRIIGLPGDKIHYTNKQLFINDMPVDEPYTIQNESQRDFSIESLYGKKVIPKDYYFVLGDNRVNSADSRSRYIGLIHKDKILGSANVIVWPLSRISNVNEVAN